MVQPNQSRTSGVFAGNAAVVKETNSVQHRNTYLNALQAANQPSEGASGRRMTTQPHVINTSNPQAPLPVVFRAIPTLPASFPLPLSPPLHSPDTASLSLSPPALLQQNYRGLLVVKSVFLQPGISTGQHSVRMLHSLRLPDDSNTPVRARCLRHES